MRVYQFNERAKHIDCIQFESVGSRSNNEGIGIDEPPGFQLRLLTLIHTADICNSAYAPTFKMVAISDKAGSVSLIDLSKPAVMWFQAPMQHPVVSLALAQCPLPSHKERSEFMSAYHDLATGSHIKTVVAVAQDSCLAVLDAANGFALSRWAFNTQLLCFCTHGNEHVQKVACKHSLQVTGLTVCKQLLLRG